MFDGFGNGFLCRIVLFIHNATCFQCVENLLSLIVSHTSQKIYSLYKFVSDSMFFLGKGSVSTFLHIIYGL